MKKIISPLLVAAAFVLLLLACTKKDDPVDPPAIAPSILGTWDFIGLTATTENKKIQGHEGDTTTTVFIVDYTGRNCNGPLTIDSTRMVSGSQGLNFFIDTLSQRKEYLNGILISSDKFKFAPNAYQFVNHTYKLGAKDSIYFEKSFAAIDGTYKTVRLGESSRGTVSITNDTLLLNLKYYGYQRTDSGHVIISQGTQIIRFKKK